jgi:serine/threonine-protein kinase
MVILGVWTVVIGLFQFLTLNRRIKPYLEYAWAATDAMLMTFVLLRVPEDLGPLVIGYPMIVASSGMFFNVRVVVCSSIFSCLGYICLWIYHPTEPIEAHYGVIYLIVLVLLGMITAHQVRRVRVLSQYYEAGE